MNEHTDIFARLRAGGFRITSQKRKILEVFLANPDRMLSVHDIHALLPNDTSIDNATVYRNIQKFLDFGILESMNDEHGVNRYTVSQLDHHHYLICTGCGKIIKIPCEGHFWKTQARANHFQESHHKLEVYGTCEECALHNRGNSQNPY